VTIIANRAEPAALPVRRQSGVLGGVAVVAGTRVPVVLVEKVYREGGVAAVREAYPDLTDAEIFGALFFASEYPEEIERDWRAIDESLKDTPLNESLAD
jgi:uncharacterized protein (DUF433 family)